MLVTQDVDDFKENVIKKRSKKTQILLVYTQRRFDNYINKLKYRDNGNYNQIPHYVITKLGVVHMLNKCEYSSNVFFNNKLDKRIIVIAIENLGWLTKNTINGILHNWIGDTYRGEPFIKEWRGKYYWDSYTNEQIQSISILCNEICDKYNIEKNVPNSNGFFENASKFKGILCKSNFSTIYTDINPSFNFKKIFQNEQ